MRQTALLCAAALSCLVMHAQAPTPAQAEALVKQGVAYAKQNSVEKLFEQTNQATGKFHVSSGNDLYLFIYDQDGNCKAIGFNTGALVGKNRIDLKDPDGKLIVREFLNVAKAKGKGWVDYKYPNPATGKIEPKTSYLELFNGLIIGCGTYK